MLGRRAVLIVGVAAATTLGGGGAFAAVHGSSHHATKPAAKPGPASNVHYPCRHHGAGASLAGLV